VEAYTYNEITVWFLSTPIQLLLCSYWTQTTHFLSGLFFVSIIFFIMCHSFGIIEMMKMSI